MANAQIAEGPSQRGFPARDPEGIVQEAFLRAHRTLREDRRPIELKPWLHRVVRNLCIDELRRLIEDLADLPEQQRAALLLRELDGLSHDEVASALVPPIGSGPRAGVLHLIGGGAAATSKLAARRNLPAPVLVRVGTLCKRR